MSIGLAPVVAGTTRLGYPEGFVRTLGVILLFPVYVAAFIWGGLLLRDARLQRALDGQRLGRRV